LGTLGNSGKQWQLALHILKLLEECQLQADDISCNAAISACAKGSSSGKRQLHKATNLPGKYCQTAAI